LGKGRTEKGENWFAPQVEKLFRVLIRIPGHEVMLVCIGATLAADGRSSQDIKQNTHRTQQEQYEIFFCPKARSFHDCLTG
jgi:hypothetical protein